MITIGVTGGVGAGKSVVMDYLKKEYNAAVIKADEAARLLEEPGQDCYNELLDIFGKSILDENGYIGFLYLSDLFGANAVEEKED